MGKRLGISYDHKVALSDSQLYFLLSDFMTQALPKLVTFEEFIEWKPEDKYYELHDGVIFEMPQPLGKHEKIAGFLARKLTVEFDRLNLPYFIPKQALVKSPDSSSCYSPDVLILNDHNLVNEVLWEKKSTVTQGASISLVIEVVSSNWRDDYYKKFADYESLEIGEYWIADYLGLGASKFVGKPKQPTLSICGLVEGEYLISQFRGQDYIQSSIFPELNLTVEQIFAVSNI